MDLPSVTSAEPEGRLSSKDQEDCTIHEEEILLYLSFPDFDDTAVVTNAPEIKLVNIMGSEPVCFIENLELAGEHIVSLGFTCTLPSHAPNNNTMIYFRIPNFLL